jgi:hypothetical protein
MVWCSNPGRGKRFFSSPKRPDQLCDSHGLLFNEYWGSFLGVKWPGHEVSHWSQSSGEVENEWSYTSATPTCLHGVEGKKLLCCNISKSLKSALVT